jgi:hypothetical protein
MRRLVLFVMLVVAPNALEAKGPTVKLTLTGPGLARSIEITDPVLLGGSNVYEGGFIGRTLSAAPNAKTPRYTVAFDVQLPDWQGAGVKTMYAVTVARDAGTGAMWLYLPGRGDAGYALNVRTILRDTHDGRWHRPSPAWAAALARHLPRR